MLMQNFGVTNKDHYGMLWYFLEWSISVPIKAQAAQAEYIILRNPQNARDYYFRGARR